MVLFLWHNGFFKLKPLLTKGLVAISLIMIVTGGYLGKDRVAETVTDFQKMEQQDYYTSLGLRVMMYRVGLDIVKENPVMGVGLNQFKQEKAYVLQTQYQSVPEHVQEMIIGFTQIHNQFLMDAIFAGVFGIVGLLAFLGYPAWLYIQFYRKSPELSTRWIAFSGLLFIGYTLFTSLFGSVFTYTYTTILYMLINLMLIAYLTQSSADSEKGGG
jgi:O-antigen ligase